MHGGLSKAEHSMEVNFLPLTLLWVQHAVNSHIHKNFFLAVFGELWDTRQETYGDFGKYLKLTR